MRIRELRLIRYGKFTDRTLSLPAAAQDIHLIVGPNEAGKSTVRQAISDWLFGIPMRTTMGFLHPMADLRIGGILEAMRRGPEPDTSAISGAGAGAGAGNDITPLGTSARLDFIRKKGRKDTLVDGGQDNKVLPANTLAAWLGQLDEDAFNRLYALDHTTLVEGSEGILQASDDIGRMLFQSAAGIGHLGEAQKQLEDEADQLWAPRKSDKRLFYQAQESFEAARRELNQAQLRTKDWKAQHDALVSTNQALDEARRRHAELQQQKSRLERIRRVQPLLLALDAALSEEAQLKADDQPLPLPEDAAQIYQEASQQSLIVEANSQHLSAELTELKQQLSSIVIDQAVLGLATEIIALNEARLRLHDHPAQIQKCRSILEEKWLKASQLANELGWSAEDESQLARQLPPANLREMLQALIDQHAGIQQAREHATQQLDKLNEQIRQWQAQVQALNADQRDNRLSALLEQARKLGDLDKIEANHQANIAQCDGLIDQALAQMGPWQQPIDTLQAMLVPETQQLQRLLDQQQEDESRLRAAETSLATQTQRIQQQELALQQLVRHHQPVSKEQLLQARARRDDHWQQIKANPDSLLTEAQGFESQIQTADELADARLERAQHEADRQAKAYQLEQLQLSAATTQTEIEAIRQQINQRDLMWQAQASACGLPQLPLALAPVWLQQRQQALAAHQQKAQTLLAHQQHQAQVEKLRQMLIERLGGEVSDSSTLTIEDALQMASARIAETNRIQGKIDTLNQQLDEASQQLPAAQSAQHSAEQQWQRWQSSWLGLLQDTGHSPDTPVERLKTQLGLMQALQTLLDEMSTLRRDQLDALQADLKRWESDAQLLATQLMSDQAPACAQAVALALHQRLETARQQQAEAERLDKAHAQKKQALDEAERQQREIAARLHPLMLKAGVTDMPALAQAIEHANQRRQIKQSIAQHQQQLVQAADGLPIEQLREEAASMDPDQLHAQLQSLDLDAQHLIETIQQLSTQQGQQKSVFDALNGDDRAAQAASRQQEAVARMTEAAERYLRLKTASRLLAWSIEKFRETHQGPMLATASTLFGQLTLGRFSRLLVDTDDHDKPRLLGIRQDGTPVDVPGLSEGTRDQLYLALRLAALTHQNDQGRRVPLIADDLFINFDDARTAAGLRMLGELSASRQIIFLTHHAHLLPLARQVLGEQLNVIEL
ncbi:MAG: AAA family ATPase [Lautropia sp.]|nr:AAA family ATPase [Lautropia sp.]